jgi:VWFA-related protein
MGFSPCKSSLATNLPFFRSPFSPCQRKSAANVRAGPHQLQSQSFLPIRVYLNTMHFRRAALCAVLGASLAPLHAQQSEVSPPPNFTVQAQLVNLPVVVRDNHGALVSSLNKDDFQLTVDGRTQPIRYFDRDNNLPLTLGLLVDISGSVRSALDNERTASEAFLDQMLKSPAGQPPDQAFLIQFAHEVDLLEDLTPSVPRLRGALRKVGDEYRPDNQAQQSGDNSSGSGHRRGFRGGTTLYDAIYLGSTDLMQKQQGRKAIVVLTDGEDRGSNETLLSAIAAAQRAETVVYAIYFKGEQHGYGGGGHGGHGGGFPGGGGRGGYPGGGHGGSEQHIDGKKVLAQITKETGGRLFEVSSKQTFASIYTQIGEELRSQYRLGYVPDQDAASDGFHHVQLTSLKDKKLSIQTRDGYYGGSKPEQPTTAAQ